MTKNVTLRLCGVLDVDCVEYVFSVIFYLKGSVKGLINMRLRILLPSEYPKMIPGKRHAV